MTMTTASVPPESEMKCKKLNQNQCEYYECNKDDPEFKAYNQEKTAHYRAKKQQDSGTDSGQQLG